MPKVSKKPPAKPGKPITDFFARKVPSSSQPSSSQPMSSPVSSAGASGQIKKAIKANAAPRVQEVGSELSGSQSSNSRQTEAAGKAIGAHNSIQSSDRPPTSPRKVTRTYGSQSLAIPLDPPRTRSRTPETHHSESTHSETVASPRPAKIYASRALATPIDSRDRSRTPEVLASPGRRAFQLVSPEPVKPSSKPLSKRKAKFDLEPPAQMKDSVICVPRYGSHSGSSSNISIRTPLSPTRENLAHQPSPVSVSSRKRQRLSSPEPMASPIFEEDETVPGSQSDEQEMSQSSFSMKDLEAMKRQEASFDMDVDFDMGLPSPISNPGHSRANTGSETPVDESINTAHISTPSVRQQVTPPSTGHSTDYLTSSPPASPVPLTAAERTAKVIADIRAKALAAVTPSSPEETPLAFKEELDDSSDEEDVDLFAPINKGKGKAVASTSKVEKTPALPSSSAHPGRTRYSLRGQPSLSDSRSPSPSSSRRTRKSTSKVPVTLTSSRTNEKKKKAANPLDLLLKEKQKANKCGKGDDAYRLAQEAVAGKGRLLSEMESEEELDDWTNEVAARNAIRARGAQLSSPNSDGYDGDDVTLNEEDQRRLLGDKRGGAIMGILQSDREKKAISEEQEVLRGVPLWIEADDFFAPMECSAAVPLLSDVDGHPILRVLRDAVERGDLAQASMVLRSGLLANVDLKTHATAIPYLCDLALSTSNDLLSTSAFHALCNIWRQPHCQATGVPFSSILAATVRIGANVAVLESLKLDVKVGLVSENPDMKTREKIVNRMIVLLTLSTRSCQLDDAAASLLVLLLIGLDPSTTNELQTDIIAAVDAICQSVAGSDVNADAEARVCTQLVHYASTLKPVNKAFLLSFFTGGSMPTERIARWVARSILLGDQLVSGEKYTDLPPLGPLLVELLPTDKKPSSRSPEVFKIDDTTDYVDMGFYSRILSTAVSNVGGYVQEDRKNAAPEDPYAKRSGSDKQEKPKTTIQFVQSAVEGLHSSIQDTRAAHLDRSRTKAMLKQVSMKIYYQIEAARKAGAAKSKPIEKYFSKKIKPTPK